MRENSKGYAEPEHVFAFMNLVSLINVNAFYKPTGDIGNNCKTLQKKAWTLQQRKSGNWKMDFASTVVSINRSWQQSEKDSLKPSNISKCINYRVSFKTYSSSSKQKSKKRLR